MGKINEFCAGIDVGKRFLLCCGVAATRKRDSIFQLRFRELAPRRGQKRAIVAIAHQMLTVLYFMLKNNIPFRGSDTAPQKHRRLRRAHHHLRCLRRLGVTVQVCGSLEDAPPTG